MTDHVDGSLDRAALEAALAEARESTSRLTDVVARLAQRERELRETRDLLELARLDLRGQGARVAELEGIAQSKAYRAARRLGDVRARIVP